jgi:hypothetical protein
MPISSEVARQNGKKGGRPRNAATRYSHKRALELCGEDETPLDVMVSNMLFWYRKARAIGEKLEEKVPELADMDASQRHDFLDMMRMFLGAREKSQGCARDAAPYMHARLQNIDMRAELRVKNDGAAKEITAGTTPAEAADLYAQDLREMAEVG